MAEELRRDRSKPKLAQAITLYHLVIEASLAQPGQHLIEQSLKRRDLLPGFREGINNVSRDEQRHIAFGVKMIADLVREDPECAAAVEEMLREIFPYTAAVFVPPGWDERYVEAFGFTLEEIFAYGAEAIEGRLRAAGLDPLSMRTGLAFDLPPQERARRGLAMLRAGYLGAPNGPAKLDPEVTALLFDGLRRQFDTSLVRREPRSSGSSAIPSHGSSGWRTGTPRCNPAGRSIPISSSGVAASKTGSTSTAGRTDSAEGRTHRQDPPERAASDAPAHPKAVRLEPASGDAGADAPGRLPGAAGPQRAGGLLGAETG